jgi:hypothetical protein
LIAGNNLWVGKKPAELCGQFEAVLLCGRETVGIVAVEGVRSAEMMWFCAAF